MGASWRDGGRETVFLASAAAFFRQFRRFSIGDFFSVFDLFRFVRRFLGGFLFRFDALCFQIRFDIGSSQWGADFSQADHGER